MTKKEYKKQWNADNNNHIKEYKNSWHSKNKERINREKRAEYKLKAEELRQLRLENPEKTIFIAAKKRAKDKQVDFSIEVEDIVIPDFCPILKNIRLEMSRTGWKTDNSPSLDRIIPELGYIKGNIQVISDRANRMKSNSTFDEMIALGDWAWQQKTIQII